MSTIYLSTGLYFHGCFLPFVTEAFASRGLMLFGNSVGAEAIAKKWQRGHETNRSNYKKPSRVQFMHLCAMYKKHVLWPFFLATFSSHLFIGPHVIWRASELCQLRSDAFRRFLGTFRTGVLTGSMIRFVWQTVGLVANPFIFLLKRFLWTFTNWACK